MFIGSLTIVVVMVSSKQTELLPVPFPPFGRLPSTATFTDTPTFVSARGVLVYQYNQYNYNCFKIIRHDDPNRPWHLFTTEDMVQGSKCKKPRKKRVINENDNINHKENLDSKCSTRCIFPLSPQSEIFNTPQASLMSQLSSNKRTPLHCSSSGFRITLFSEVLISYEDCNLKSVDVMFVFEGTMRSIVPNLRNGAVPEDVHREPLSNITNLRNQTSSRKQKGKGKAKVGLDESTHILFEDDFMSTYEQNNDDHNDQIENSIIAESGIYEDESDDSNDEYCTEDVWFEDLNTESEVVLGASTSANCSKKASRIKVFFPEEYASLGGPSVKCTKCNASMWKEERVNKNVTRGIPLFSLCCKKGEVKLPSALPTPPYLMQLYQYERRGEDGYHNKIRFQNANPESTKERDMISMKDYYSYSLQVRENEGMTPRLGGRLFQQYVTLRRNHILESALE
ncbi:hypothetical protein POM88_034891 [Heracleum sosnowskyi]|uniref:Uncharacterized protein n=1 Tax=Heracleum sosnowskyi TaxID=360622 RepID=A0AAD8HKE7_9APIA|nr:hypothetical protein POM88_034891 [Heracleum sosnowskyi]